MFALDGVVVVVVNSWLTTALAWAAQAHGDGAINQGWTDEDEEGEGDGGGHEGELGTALKCSMFT